VKDLILSHVYQYVLVSWPQKGVSDGLKPFYQRRDQLSMDQGCLLWGTRVVIPNSLRNHLLKELYCTHPGIIKMKLLARSYMWWPGLDLDVEGLVKNCQECALQRNLPPVSPLHSWPWANMPMKRIHVDFAEIEGYQVLIIVDVHSKWIEAIPVTTSTTFQALQIFFANFGLPEKIVSDNGLQFTATDFAEYCMNKGIKHSRTPLYHPATRRVFSQDKSHPVGSSARLKVIE